MNRDPSAFACVGDNCIDRYLPPLNDVMVGGNAVNVAVQLAMLGRPVSYHGAVGADAAGLAVRTALERMGVGVHGLHVMAQAATAHTDIAVSDGGERSFVFEDFGASALYRPAETDLPALRRCRHVHIGWINDTGALRRALAGAGVTVSQDLSVNNTDANLEVEGLDIAFCSAAPENAEAVLRQTLRRGAALVVVTLGAAGSMAGDGHRMVMAPADSIAPLDTTGAGDAFIAGFIHSHAAGRDLSSCLRHAAAVAARACLHRGGFPQSPLAAGAFETAR